MEYAYLGFDTFTLNAIYLFYKQLLCFFSGMLIWEYLGLSMLEIILIWYHLWLDQEDMIPIIEIRKL